MTHRRPTLQRAVMLAVSTVLTAAGLAGCGDAGDGPQADPTSELSLDASADADTDLPQGVPTEAPSQPGELGNTPADARKFAEYVFHQFQYASFRNDPEAFLALGSCPSCDNWKEALRQLRREGAYEVLDSKVEPRFVTPLYREGGVHAFGVSYDLPGGKKVAADGEVLTRLEGQKKKYMEIGVEYRGKKWQLVDLAITD